MTDDDQTYFTSDSDSEDEEVDEETRLLDVQGKFRCDHCSGIFDYAEHNYRLNCKPCQKKYAEHEQVEAEGRFWVDKKLLGLINVLNRDGYFTVNSCEWNQPEKKQAWIEFEWQETKDRLLKQASNHHRILHQYLKEQDWSLVEDSDSVSLRFPAADIDKLCRWLTILQQRIISASTLPVQRQQVAANG